MESALTARHRLPSLLAGAALAFLAMANASNAATLTSTGGSGGTISYADPGAEINNLVVTQSTPGMLSFNDAVGVTPSAPCTPAGAQRGDCPLGPGNEIAEITINVGGMNDTVDLSSTVMAPHFSVLGGLGADTLTGSANADLLDGQLDNDTLQGYDGNDTIWGGDGNDALSGGNGFDDLSGGPGDDAVDARDGVAEPVDCGTGTDTATVDSSDTVINCETVDGGGGGSSGGGGDVSAPVISGVTYDDGTIVYSISEPGAVAVKITRLSRGRKVKNGKGKAKCVKSTKKRRKLKRCTRRKLVAQVSSTVTTADLGNLSVKGPTSPGKYEVAITATDAAGNQTTLTKTFTVKKKKR